ncbi:hypothetical protein NKH47_01775 [Mesorhizobium sp. M1060]|uniref:hypothetical protein n=1 Tax=Mesorhizobium sp. M1060 TaxID=2957052 RepID=UPI0033390BA6
MPRPATAAVRLLTGEREPVRLATTANIDVDTGGLLTIDGIVTEVGDRVLVKDQTDGSENGIRTVSEGQWYRAADSRSARTMQKGTTVHVQEGTSNAGKTFVFNTLNPVVGDSDIEIVFYLSDDSIGEVNDAIAAGLVTIAAAGDTELAEIEAASVPILAQANQSALNAAAWAITPENTPVVPGAFSALHWAAKAAASATILAALVAGFGAIWTTILQTSTTAAAWVALQTSGYLTTRAALKALTPAVGMTVYVAEGARRGFFKWTLGNFSTHIAADTLEGFYIKATSVAATVGCWVREGSPQVLEVEWFDAAPNTTTDSQPAIMAANALLVAVSGTTEGSIGTILATRGKYRLGASLAFSKPVKFVCDNYLEYTPTTLSAVIIGAAAPGGGRNTGYDIDIRGLRAVNGNAGAPTGVNAAGCSGLEIRNMQFSRVRVGMIIAFTKYGFWGNQSNDIYSGQHCQDNLICIDEPAVCGVGVYIESVSAALGAFQVNEVHVQNSFANWINFSSPVGDTNTNNNYFHYGAMDGDTGGGAGFISGGWNTFFFGYSAGTIVLRAGSQFNKLYGHNLVSTGNVVTDGGTRNLIQDATVGTSSPEYWKTAGLTPVMTLESSNNTAVTAADVLDLYRSFNMAANDRGAGMKFSFNNASGTKTTGARIRIDTPVTTAGIERARLIIDTMLSGAVAEHFVLDNGLYIDSATGGSKGVGTFNLNTAYYVAGTKVIGPQQTGWTAGTGTALKGAFAAYAGVTHTGAYVQATIQALDDATRNASQRVRAIEDALRTHGLIN